MKTVSRILVGGILAIAVVAAVVIVIGFTSQNSTASSASSAQASSGSPVSDIKTAATSAVFNTSGIKNTINDALEANTNQIASATGLTTSQVETAIDELDVENWTVVSTPGNLSETGSYDVSADGVDATLTTYDDPSYVTVDAYGQSATFAVPDSAATYTSYLSALAA